MTPENTEGQGNKEDCIFCKIVRGEVPAENVWEDEMFIAFADAKPRVEGHTLVVPKKHFDNFMELDDATSENYINAIKETAMILIEKHEADGFNVALNNGEAAGQIVGHVHFHIHPRKKEDNKKFDIN